MRYFRPLLLALTLLATPAFSQPLDDSGLNLNVLWSADPRYDRNLNGLPDCGDRVLLSGDTGTGTPSTVDWLEVHFTLPLPSILRPVPNTFQVLLSPEQGTTTLLSGTGAGDSYYEWHATRICAAGHCGPAHGLSWTADAEILGPTFSSRFCVQATATGANGGPFASDNTATLEPHDETCFNFDNCPGGPPPLTPNVSVTKTASLATDADSDSLFDQGDRIRYTALIRNTGTATAPSSFYRVEIPANTDLVIGSVTTTQGSVLEGNTAGSQRVRVALGTLTGAIVTVRFDVLVDNPVPATVTLVSAQGEATGQNFLAVLSDDPGLPGSADPTVVPLDFDPDLTVTKTDGGATSSPGSTIAYTLTASNLATRSAAAGVFLQDLVPPSTVFNAGASSAGWTCTPSGNPGSTCRLNLPTLAAGASTARNIAFTVAPTVPAGVTAITNTASVDHDATQGPDTNPSNNSSTDTTPILATPDLTLTKNDGGATATTGTTIAYALTASNVGNQGALGVTLTDQVPAHTTFTAAASSSGWTCTPNGNPGSTCTLSLGSLGAGSSLGRTIAFTVAASLPGGVTEITNTATVADNGANGSDPSPQNNSATDQTPLTGLAPALTLVKTLNPASQFVPGGIAIYDLSYSNTGNVPATDILLTDVVPSGTTFAPASSTPGWACTPDDNAGASCTLSRPDLAPGASSVVQFAVHLPAMFPPGLFDITNCATVTGDSPVSESGAAQACHTNAVPAAPDLALTKSDGGISILAGETVAYTLTASNLGTRASTGVFLTDFIPVETSFAPEASTPGWSCSPDGNPGSQCQFQVGDLASSPVVVVIALHTLETATHLTVNNAAVVSDDGANGVDSDPQNNAGMDSTPLTLPEPEAAHVDAFLSDLILVADATAARPGDTILYTADLYPGAGLPANVHFSVPPPFGTELLGNVTTTAGTVLAGAPGDLFVEILIPSLDAPATITFEVRVLDPLPELDMQQVEAQGSVDGANFEPLLTDDPDTSQSDDPTLTPLQGGGAPRIVEVPTLTEAGFALFALSLAAAAAFLIRRRRTSPIPQGATRT